MITSKTKAYVWIYLPNSIEPVVAGLIEKRNNKYLFTYGQSYLKRDNSISIYPTELPLKSGTFEPKFEIASCIRDSSPDAWGRRVILYNLTSDKKNIDSIILDELTFLLLSGSDRIGFLDFQESPTEYIPRAGDGISLKELSSAVEKIEQGKSLSLQLELALLHGTSIGGARPKVLISQKDKKYIAKFSSSSDYYNVIKAEYIAMRLASLSGLNVANVQLKKVGMKDVLFIERFDRVYKDNCWHRLGMLSALTLFGLDEMEARYASYEELATIIRHSFIEPKKTLKELFSRMVFNLLVSNTDDHARNHAAFWNGQSFSLTPAYDICPQARTGEMASQAMKIYGDNNQSQLIQCLYAAPSFGIKMDEAISIVQKLVFTIESQWNGICKEAKLSKIDKKLFERNQFLNPYLFYGLEKFTQQIVNPWNISRF